MGCSTDQKDEQIADTNKRNESSTIVTTIVSEVKPFEHYFEIQGQVVSKKNLLVLPEMGGLIQMIAVEDGQRVNKRQLIATLSSDLLNANMDELEEQLTLAKYVLEKQTELADQGLGTELQLKEATTNYNTLLKTKETLLTQKDKYAIYAAFDGYVVEVFVSVGQLGTCPGNNWRCRERCILLALLREPSGVRCRAALARAWPVPGSCERAVVGGRDDGTHASTREVRSGE